MPPNEELKKKAFTPLKDSQSSKDHIKELARRKRVGIERGEEELERSLNQGQTSSQIVADKRATAAAGATSGVQGITQANKLLQADVAGMARTAAFEGDLASRDFAAQQDAEEKLGAFQVDLDQDAIETSAKELSYDTTQENFKTQMTANFIDTYQKEHGKVPNSGEINSYLTLMGI